MPNLAAARTATPEAPPQAALFIDYENVYYHLKEEWADPPDLNHVVVDLLRNLRAHMETGLGLNPIVMKAYADYDRLPEEAQGSLYLMGVETRYVLGTDHKNAADMRLCIDLLEVLYTRTDIRHFVLMAGDRDYIPVVQHLRRQGCGVKVVAFSKTLSGDLRQNMGVENLVDAEPLLGEDNHARLLRHRATPPKVKVIDKIDVDAIQAKYKVHSTLKPAVPKDGEAVAAAVPTAVLPTPAIAAPAEPPKPSAAKQKDPPPVQPSTAGLARFPVRNEQQRECLRHILLFKEEKDVPEVWMRPFLYHLADAMPTLADWERTKVVSALAESGAVQVEKRPGFPNPFSVIVVNYNHPTVIELLP